MDKKLTTTIIVGVVALVIGAFLGNLVFPCPCDTEEYVGELRIMEERVISQEIVPIDYDELNRVLSNYTTCPEGMDCYVDDLKFVNIYGTTGYAEKDRLILMTQIVDKLYDDMPFLYDRTISFKFKAIDNETNIDEIYVQSNRWSRKIN
jgi:hypothetical protein